MGSHWDVLCKAAAVLLFTVSQAIVAPGPQFQPLYYGKQCAGVQSHAFDGNNTTPNSLVWHIMPPHHSKAQSHAFDGNNTTPNSLVWHIMPPHDSKVTLTQAHPIG